MSDDMKNDGTKRFTESMGQARSRWATDCRRPG